MEPLTKYLDATPACLTDIQSWFGLVNQKSQIMLSLGK